jgi:tetratricopeptide (TPR) repeat protein
MTTDLRDRYSTFIETIIQMTLQGKVRSKEQIYRRLIDELEPGTSEVFDSCLGERRASLETQANLKDDLQQAKATRALRALNTLESEWQRYQQETQAKDVLSSTLFEISNAEASDRLEAFLTRLDPNHPNALNDSQLTQLATNLKQEFMTPELQEFGLGVQRGMASWQALQPHLISWMFERGDNLGFQNDNRGPSPWKLWAAHSPGVLSKGFFTEMAGDGSIEDWLLSQTVTLPTWLELTIVLQRIQQGLIAWATTQIYSNKTMGKFLTSLYVGFSGTWMLLGRGVGGNSPQKVAFAQTAFRSGLQVLRLFTQQPFFPFYGNLILGFGGRTFNSTMEYFSEPLRTVEGTQVKARILTLMGNFVRVAGSLEEATTVYRQALGIAQEAGDRLCEVANLNHLSRTMALSQDYAGAIAQSQRALILSRQSGDALGEANALTNLGYAEVLTARSREAPPEDYEIPMNYLEQGAQKAIQLEDPQSEAFSSTSLGIAHLTCGDASNALHWIRQGLEACHRCGDAYLQAVNLLSMAEACYQLERFADCPYPALLAMYHLYQLEAREWRQAAGLVTILQGRQSMDWQSFLQPERGPILAQIGPEGIDLLAEILERYRLGE